jgi:hypothetical protein
MPAGPESLARSALNAQLQARSREAQLTYLFLVTGALSCPTDVSNTMSMLSNREQGRVIQRWTSGVASQPSEGPSASAA